MPSITCGPAGQHLRLSEAAVCCHIRSIEHSPLHLPPVFTSDWVSLTLPAIQSHERCSPPRGLVARELDGAFCRRPGKLFRKSGKYSQETQAQRVMLPDSLRTRPEPFDSCLPG
jgi:hypothetical protein